jgi:acyl dehydratase
MSARRVALAELPALVGQELGTSEWIAVDQERIDAFARVTGDHQWLHVDPERAARGPFGTTIAHGYLTLSLMPALIATAYAIDGAAMGVNYGLNRVRFPAPVPSGSRLRARFVLARCEPLGDWMQLTVDANVEREGSDRPVCVAQLVARYHS